MSDLHDHEHDAGDLVALVLSFDPIRTLRPRPEGPPGTVPFGRSAI
jgi:hypothetical protein